MRVPPGPVPSSSFRPAPSALNRENADLPAESATVGSVDTGPSEIVLRPTGLRHGRWEAHEWAFWTMGAIILVAAIVYGLVRVGVIDMSRLRRKT